MIQEGKRISFGQGIQYHNAPIYLGSSHGEGAKAGRNRVRGESGWTHRRRSLCHSSTLETVKRIGLDSLCRYLGH